MSETSEERLKRLLGVLDEELPDEEEARATVERLGINVPAMAERIQDLVAGRSVCRDGEGARLSLYPEVRGTCEEPLDPVERAKASLPGNPREGRCWGTGPLCRVIWAGEWFQGERKAKR